MLHEAVGHGLEGDFNRKKTSAFAGLMGQQVAAKGVTVVDDGTIELRRGSLSIDDEGTPTSRTVLIEDGILVGYMQDRQNARLMGMKPTGNGRRESYAHVPMPRMTNTYMLAGDRDPDEIIASVKNGIYAVNFGGGQVDITSGKYVFQVTEAYKIENGKLGAPLKGAMLIGNGPTDLNRITHGRQRPQARHRHRHLRQERPGRAGRRRPADAAHGRASRSAGRAECLKTHHAGEAAGFAHRRRDVVLEVATRRWPAIARPHIGPGAAAFLAPRRRLTVFPVGIGRNVEVAIVAAEAVDAEFDRSVLRLDHAGAAHARHAAGGSDARRHRDLSQHTALLLSVIG